MRLHPLARRAAQLVPVLALVLAACADPPPSAPAPRVPARPRAAVQGVGTPVGTELAPGKCLDVWAVSTEPGAGLVIWPCHGGPNQQFTLPAPGTTGEIRAYGTMCVDIYGGRGEDGAPIVIWPCHGGPNQQWTVSGDGQVRGMNDKCLDVGGWDSSDGARVIAWACHGGGNQRWHTGAETPAVLVGAGDVARCTSGGDEVTAALLDGIPGTVFAAGDLAYPDGTVEDFANCYDASWGRHRWRTRPAPGNHEYHVGGAWPYFAYFGEAAGPWGLGYYSYDVGAWHAVVLNSNIDASHGSAQAAWLRADLAANPRQCTVAYWHHPRFSSGVVGNNARMQALWEILYDAGADVVLNGHAHQYERFAPQTPWGDYDEWRGLREFVVGTGGASRSAFVSAQPNSEVRRSDTYGVLKLELYASRYRWTFITPGGTADAGEGGCH